MAKQSTVDLSEQIDDDNREIMNALARIMENQQTIMAAQIGSQPPLRSSLIDKLNDQIYTTGKTIKRLADRLA